MNKEESPYCEICGHCGEIGCCGVESFINNHIKGKTNCKNEDSVIKEIFDICEYETKIFKENELLEKYKSMWEEIKIICNQIEAYRILQEIEKIEQKYNLGSDKDGR